MQKKVMSVIWAVVGISILVCGLKFTAYYLTNSTALYSDALESLVNIAGSIMSLYAIYLSFQPADHNHVYGHHKAEYLSAVVEGLLIVVTAILIFYHAFVSFSSYSEGQQILLSDLKGGIFFSFLALVINGLLSLFLLIYSKRYKSPALHAEAHHLSVDVLVSVGVIAGVIFVWWSGWSLVDILIACAIAIFILVQGVYIIISSVNGLMDHAVSDDECAKIQQIIAENSAGALEYHDLKSRIAGRITFVEFHLVVSRDMSVGEAHDICDRIEQALEQHGYIVIIHVEPDTHAHGIISEN